MPISNNRGDGGAGINWEPVGEAGVWSGSQGKIWYGAATAVDMGDVEFAENELLAVTNEGGTLFLVFPGHYLNAQDGAADVPVKGGGTDGTTNQVTWLSGTSYLVGRTASNELVLAAAAGTTYRGTIRLWRSHSQLLA